MTLHIEVGSMLGGFLVDLGWIWGAFGVDFRCWEGLGRVFGGSWAALGSPWAPKIDLFNRFGVDVESVLGPQTDQNLSLSLYI